MSGIPYIGARISLISKADIRYEGILYTIDAKESTVALQDVRSHGTEDRRHDKFVGPSDAVYDYIVFRGTDIKDLAVVDQNAAKEQAPPEDPAIVAKKRADPVETAPKQEAVEQKKPATNSSGPPPGFSAGPNAAPKPRVENNPQQPPKPRVPIKVGEDAKELAYRTIPGENVPAPVKYEAEFDMEAQNKLFEKDDIEPEEEDDSTPVYDKNLSFFDSLSSNTSSRMTQEERQKQREIDLETFGATGIRHGGRFGYRGRGRGRGGWRGGRGRGRGGRGRGRGNWRQQQQPQGQGQQ